MAQSEQAIQQHIILACSKGGTRLFRNNCGSYQTPQGKWVKYGVANPGGSDLIGLRTVTITPEMVGRKLAVFSAIEVKTPTGRATEQQQQFIEMVRSFGGIAGIARSVEQAQQLLGQ